MIGIALAEKGLLPDALLRVGIRSRLKGTLRDVGSENDAQAQTQKQKWISELKTSPIALVPEKANEQHYELPPEFFELVLGKHLKYSSGYWPDKETDLDASERAMLALSCQRADLQDGQDILELGCGWGSLSLWMAEHYSQSQILAVSNSGDQRAFIMKRAEERGLKNLTVQTADMNDFSTDKVFDRVVSIEMFEHMRNYETLMGRISGWLKPGGKLFVHIFTHEKYAYPYLERSSKDWMTRFFFSGGQMPSHDLLPHFQGETLSLEDSWKVSGTHYARTSRAWLEKMDSRDHQIMDLFKKTYGADQANIWFQRWRLFFMACEELFAFKGGEEWFVSHYLFQRK